jgi:hypothetical protein
MFRKQHATSRIKLAFSSADAPYGYSLTRAIGEAAVEVSTGARFSKKENYLTLLKSEIKNKTYHREKTQGGWAYDSGDEGTCGNRR